MLMETLCKRRCEVVRLLGDTNTLMNKGIQIIEKNVYFYVNATIWYIFHLFLKYKSKKIVYLQPLISQIQKKTHKTPL